MKRLLLVTAVIEAGAGVALLCCQSLAVQQLLGSSTETTINETLARLLGAALCALGVANWLARYDEQSPVARGLVCAMVLYNVGTVLTLGAVGIWSRTVGPALWPAVILHIVMSVWCITDLFRKVGQTN